MPRIIEMSWRKFFLKSLKASGRINKRLFIYYYFRDKKKDFGRITSNKLESQIEAILKNWETWRVFDLSYIQGLGMSLKIPTNFNPKTFDSNDTLTLFENDFTVGEKAKTIALDIAKLNFQRIKEDNKEGKLNLKLMCNDKGINLGEGRITDEQMLTKLNSLTFAKLIDDLSKSQDTKGRSSSTKNIQSEAEKGSKKKNLNFELMRIYDLYSHIYRTNQKLENNEEGLPLTAEDIEKFGLEEDITNIASRGKDVFQEMLDDVNMVDVNTDIGEMKVYNSDLNPIQTIETHNLKSIQGVDDIEGLEIANFSWLESIQSQEGNKEMQNYKWFSAKIHKDNFSSIKFKDNEEKKERRSTNNHPFSINNSIPIRSRSSLRSRARGVRGSRGSMAAQNVETHQNVSQSPQTRSIVPEKEEEDNSSNSDMMSVSD